MAVELPGYTAGSGGARGEDGLEEATRVRGLPSQRGEPRINGVLRQLLAGQGPVGGSAHVDVAIPSVADQLEVFQIVVFTVCMPVPELERDASAERRRGDLRRRRGGPCLEDFVVRSGADH